MLGKIKEPILDSIADRSKPSANAESLIDQKVEEAVAHAVFGSDLRRREFIRYVGVGGATAILNSIFPMGAAKALAQGKTGPIEKKELKVGFIPITCATPIIMAEPMGFYKKHGLDVQVHKASGWAMIRDLSINGETDATHMLTPMPLAISMGTGSQSVPFVMPAIENINGQAITLANKHKGVKEAKEMKGFKFCVPFDYSMHNFLLRYFLAEGGIDPDKDVQIRVVPPAEMVANLRAGNVDGYLAPDPFNQRAVYEGEGFIFMLSKDIWPGHPCCAFATRKDFAEKNPNTFQALFKAIVDATQYAHDAAHRKGNRQSDCAAQLLEPAGGAARTGFNRRVSRRLGKHEECAGPHRLRSVPVSFHGDLDSHTDETLGLYQARCRLQETRPRGLSGVGLPRSHEVTQLQGAGAGFDQAPVYLWQE